MNIREAKANDEMRLREFWQAIFGDEDEYLSLFFGGFFEPERTLVAEEGGKLIAMCFFPRVFLSVNGEKVPAGYLCGAATVPARRGEGIMSRLIGLAVTQMREAGDEACFLIPASQSLISYYEKFGFQPYFYRRVFELLPAGEESRDRALLYERYLAGRRGVCPMLDEKQFAASMKEFLRDGQAFLDGEVTRLCRDGEVFAWGDVPCRNGAIHGMLLPLTGREFPGGGAFLDMMMD